MFRTKVSGWSFDSPFLRRVHDHATVFQKFDSISQVFIEFVSIELWLKRLTIYFSSKFRYVKQVGATSPFLDVFEIWYGITMLQHVEIQWLIFTGKCAKCETVILPTNFSKLKISQIILAGKLMEQIREVHHIFVYVVYV